MAELPEPLTPDDLARRPDGDAFELIDGTPVEKVKGAYPAAVGGHLFTLLDRHVQSGRLGHVFGPRAGYRCFPGRPLHLRRPDVSFVAAGWFPDEVVPAGPILFPPDLCAEIVGPTETYDQVEVKVTEFLRVGVRLVWVISPEAETVVVRRRDKTCVMLDATNTLSGEDVLPGLVIPVADLFE